jgi:hypothetical protein
VSGSSGGGESISVHEEGDELSFVGGGRVYRTNQCYDQLPTLVRETHSRSASGREWRTRCTTPPNDPRRAVINTLVVATNDSHLEIVETGRYEISLAAGLCTADIKRSRSLNAVAKDTPAASVTPPPPVPAVTAAPAPPPDPSRCGSPGEPTRLEVRPSQKLLRAGESFTFHAVVLDAAGCATRTGVTWLASPGSGKGLTVDASGNVTVAADATLGGFDIAVSAAGKSAHVTVQVASPSSYDELLSQSGLNDAGESAGAAIAEIASAQIGGRDTQAEDSARRTKKTIFIAIIVLLSLALGAVALVSSRRAKKARSLEAEAQARHAARVAEAETRRRDKAERHAQAMKAHEDSVEAARKAATEPLQTTGRMICPACRREYDSGSTFCPADANRLVPIQGGSDPLAGPGGSICPTCKRGFDPGVKVCPHDKDELIPYALYASRSPGTPAPRGKICPTCGDRFSGTAEFCGKDGTALVLLN